MFTECTSVLLIVPGQLCSVQLRDTFVFVVTQKGPSTPLSAVFTHSSTTHRLTVALTTPELRTGTRMYAALLVCIAYIAMRIDHLPGYLLLV